MSMRLRSAFSGLWTLSIALSIAAPVSAQPRPSRFPSRVLAPNRIVRDAASDARFLVLEDGRIRRAWGLAIEVDGADAEARARAFLRRYQSELALGPGARLSRRAVIESHGRTVVRFVRIAFQGPVVGSSVVVRLRGRTVDYVGLAGVASSVSASARRIGRDAAVALALRPAERAIEVTPVALERRGGLIPAWQVDTVGRHRHERRRVLVDATNGAIVLSHPLVLDVLGRVFESDPITDHSMTTDVELTHLTSRNRLTGRYFRVESCNAGERGCDPLAIARADGAGDFLYEPVDPSFDDPFSEVHAYFHSNVVAEYFRDAHRFTWGCGGDTLMHVFVNYTTQREVPFDNAAYFPSSGDYCGFMLFGQGAERDFAYDADVIYHEFTHAVIDATAGLGSFLVDALGVSYEPGAVNEGTADYFAATVEGDPRLAEYVTAGSEGPEGAVRSLDNDLVCPDDLVGEAHLDGRIWGGLAWGLRETLGPEKADALVFSTVVALDSEPSLTAAAETLLATADAMRSDAALTAEDQAAVEAAVDARGLTGCQRIVPLDGGNTRLAYSGLADLTASFGGSVAPVHYRVDLPADATALRLRFEPASSVRVHVREGEPVQLLEGSPPQIASTSDYGADEQGELVVDRRSDPPLPRCATLYLAVVAEDLRTSGASLFEVTAELERSGAEEPCAGARAAGSVADDRGESMAADTGPPPASAADVVIAADGGPSSDPPGGSCGCRAVGASGRGLSLGLLFVLAWLRRR